MDHIPYPSSTNQAPIEVPFLYNANFQYEYDYDHDYDRWQDFPQRYGWDITSFYKGDFSYQGMEDDERAASFLQAWLYFGLMVEIFGQHVPPTDFVRYNDHHERIITTNLLPEYIDEWQRRIESLSSEERQIQLNKIDKFTRESLLIYLHCDDSIDLEDLSPRNSRMPLSPEIVLSIVILHSTLSVAINRAFGQRREVAYFQTTRILDERLLANGWCRSDLRWLQDRGGITSLGMFYATLLGPRNVRKSHASCNVYRCKAYQVKEEEYVTRHLKDNCGCELIAPSMDELCSIIEKPNGIPLVIFREANEGRQPTLDVVEFQAGVQYIAISHVWGEGLGNPDANAMPICQLKRIQNYVTKAIDTFNTHEPKANTVFAPFWMDTLCVPVLKTLRKYRELAITRMAKTYSQAVKTLVLSAELESTSSHISEEELAMRITCNSWWRRLWTLQEAVLSRNLFFQLGDDAKSIEYLIAKLRDTSREISFKVSNQLFVEALEPLSRLESMRANITRERGNDLWDTVMWRSTSKQRDEAICLATIMGLNSAHILETPDDDNLKTFILMQREFRSDFIFRLGPRMEQDGYGWAPITFISNVIPDAYQKASAPLARADTSGLHVNYPGLLFSVEHLSLAGDKLLFVNDDDRSRYEVRLHPSWTPRTPFKCWKEGIWPKQQSWSDLHSSRGIQRGALIIENWPLVPDHTVSEVQVLDDQSRDLLAELLPDYSKQLKRERPIVSRPTRGVLGLVCKEDLDEIYVQFYGTAIVSQSVSLIEFAQLQRESHVINVIDFKKTQNWCVL